MVLLFLIEKRIQVAFILGIPTMVAMLLSLMTEKYWFNLGPNKSPLEVVGEEISLIRQGKTIAESKLKVPILLWLMEASVVHSASLTTCPGLEVSCIISSDHTLNTHPMTQGFMFYGSSFHPAMVPAKNRNGREFGLVFEQSPSHNFFFCHESIINMFNFTSTFKLASDLPATLSHLAGLDQILDETYLKTPEEKDQLKMDEHLKSIVYLQFNCDTPTQRDHFVQELSKFIPMDSYGQCLNNRNRSKDETDLDLISKYKFVIAIESGVSSDFISSKLWNALQAGTIPIYFGAENVEQFLPTNRSIINIRSFKKVSDLAKLINSLDHNPEEYKRYLIHKKRYSNSRKPITNQNLIRLLEEARKWPITGRIEPQTINNLEALQCLMCQRIHDRLKLERMGFKAQIRYQASKDHMSCPFPTNDLGDKLDDPTPPPGLAHWQEQYGQAFVRSLIAGFRFEAKKAYREEIFHAIMRTKEIARLVDKWIESEGDILEDDLTLLKRYIKTYSLRYA